MSAHLSPEAPLVALVADLHGGKDLAELVRTARWRRKRVAVMAAPEPESPAESLAQVLATARREREEKAA